MKRIIANLTLVVLVGSMSTLAITCSRNTRSQQRQATTTSNPATCNSSTSGESADARWARLSEACSRITPGMTQEEVGKTLGRPDQENPLYEPQISHPLQIGRTWFYFKHPEDGMKQTNCVIAIRFDMNQKFSVADKWGPSTQPIEMKTTPEKPADN